MKHTLSIFLISLCLFSCKKDIDNLLLEDAQCNLNTITQESVRRQKQAEAYGNYLQLLNEIKLVTRTGSLEEFPEYYGGAYINDESQLVIRIKDNATSTRSVNNLYNRMQQDVSFESCEFSFNELETTMQNLLSHIIKDEIMQKNITMLAIDIKQNKVAICMKDTSCSHSKSLEKHFKDKSILTYIKSEEAELSPTEDEAITSSYYEATDTLFYGAGFAAGYMWGRIKSRGTIGYRAVNENGKKGFVTAAHVVLDSSGVLLSKVYDREAIKTIGTCYNYAYHNQFMDAAFVECYDDIVLTNHIPSFSIYPSDTLSKDLIRPVTGMYLNMIGSVSGLKSGKVIYPRSILLSHNITDGNSGQIVLKDVITAEFYGQNGDSGGLVFGEDANMNYCAAGIYIGRGIHNDNTVSISVMASHANASLGVTRY